MEVESIDLHTDNHRIPSSMAKISEAHPPNNHAATPPPHLQEPPPCVLPEYASGRTASFVHFTLQGGSVLLDFEKSCQLHPETLKPNPGYAPAQFVGARE